MRCLYCGNELALLKKLTGYGEFCSEAHRQKYQEQYNRLALTRLLQAQEPEAQRRAPLSRMPARPVGLPSPSHPQKELESGPAEPMTPLPAASEPAPPQFTPPDLSGFLPHIFEPASLSVTRLLPDAIVPSTAVSLPDSHGGVPAVGGSSGDPDSADVVISITDRGRWAIVDEVQPLDLPLARVKGSPIRTDSAVLLQFSATYEHTLEKVLTLAGAPLAKQSQLEAQTQTKPTRERAPVVIDLAALRELDPEPVPLPEPEIPAPPPLITEPVVFHLPLVDDAFTPIGEACFDAPEFRVQTPAAPISLLRAKVIFGPRPVSPDSGALTHELPVQPEAATPASTVEAPPDVETPVHPAHETDSAEISEIPPADLSGSPPPVLAEDRQGSSALALATVNGRKAAREQLESSADFHSSKQSMRIKVVIALILAILIGTYLLHQARAARAAMVGSAIRVDGPRSVEASTEWSARRARPQKGKFVS